MKIINNNKLYIILLYFIGIIHWFCFFYLVDYYEYSNENIYDDISKIEENNIIIFDNTTEKYYFTAPIDIGKISDNYFKKDKSLLHSFLENPKILNLFKNKKFLYQDWVTEHNAMYVYKYSFENKIIPYHSYYGVGNETNLDRWLGYPLIPLTPQIFLLNFFDTQTYFFINLLLMFTIGFIGCLLIKNRYNLSNIPFIFLFLIYNFNGYIVEKISAYGPHLMGYFLLPYLFYFIFIASDDHLDKKNQINIGILLGITTSFILLQGSLHLYSISITFLGFWAVINLKMYLFSITSFITSFSLSAIKIVPAYFGYGNKENHHYWEAGGYANLSSFFESFIVLKNHFDVPEFSSWEFSLFIGFFAIIFIIYFGVINSFISDYRNKNYLLKLGIPLLLMIFISFRHFKHLIIPQWIPLLNSESITSRYMIIPLLLLTIIAVINFQKFLNRGSLSFKVKFGIYTTLLVTFISLVNHSRNWRMHLIENQNLWYKKLLSIKDISINQNFIENNYNDIIYIYAFWVGAFLSFITMIIILFWILIFKSNVRKN